MAMVCIPQSNNGSEKLLKLYRLTNNPKDNYCFHSSAKAIIFHRMGGGEGALTQRHICF